MLTILTTGCWDQREIEERTSAVAIGIDRPENHPELVQISVQIPIPIKIAGSTGGSGGSGDPVKIMSATGRTINGAFNNLQNRLNQELFYGHTRIIAIGEEMARSGLHDVMDTFRRDPQIRRLLWPLVVKGKAADLLTAKPEIEQIPAVYLMSMIEDGTNTGQIPEMNLGRFYIALSSSSEQPFLNYIEVKDNDIAWKGVAVFREDKMVGVLNEIDTWSMLRIRDKRDGGVVVFEYKGNPEHLISFTTETIRVDDQYSYNNGQLIVKIKLLLEGDLVGKTFKSDFSAQSEIHQLEEDAEAYLEKQAKEMLAKLQKKYSADILGLGNFIRAYHPEIWKRLDWPEDFGKADIRVTYDIKLRRTGMEMQ